MIQLLFIAVSLQQPVVCEQNQVCPVDAGQCVENAGWVMSDQVYQAALAANAEANRYATALKLLKDSHLKLEEGLTSCRKKLELAAPVVEAPPPVRIIEPDRIGEKGWRTVMAGLGAACVGGAWVLAEKSESIGPGWGASIAGACLAGLITVNWSL